MLLGMEVGLGTGHIVLDGDPASLPPKKGGGGAQNIQFSNYVCCGQTAAGWIQMRLGAKVGLCPDHIMLHGDPAHPPKGHSTPFQFSVDVYCGQMVAHLSYC